MIIRETAGNRSITGYPSCGNRSVFERYQTGRERTRTLKPDARVCAVALNYIFRLRINTRGRIDRDCKHPGLSVAHKAAKGEMRNDAYFGNNRIVSIIYGCK